MANPDPVLCAQEVLREPVLRAGVFGLQDRTVAAGLLGTTALATAHSGLARVSPEPSPASAALATASAWCAVSVLVAVTQRFIHVCTWDYRHGSRVELTRFDRAATTVSVAGYRRARRMILTDHATGYALVLTATVSRLSPFGSGAQSVLTQLAASPPSR